MTRPASRDPSRASLLALVLAVALALTVTPFFAPVTVHAQGGGGTIRVDEANRLTVIVDTGSGRVVTVDYGRIRQ